VKLKPHVQTLLPVLDLVLSSLQAHFEADGVLKRRANSSPPFSGLSVKESFALKPIQNQQVTKEASELKPPFQSLSAPLQPRCLSVTHPKAKGLQKR
jgi:hypothetical protein